MNTRIRNPIFAFLISIMLFIVFSVPAYAADTTNIGKTPSGIPYDRLEQEIDGYVNSHIGKSTPGAAIVVTKGDKVIFSKGYGYANIEKKTAVDPASTVFAYGSINKAFVWTSVMQLVEAGKMELDQDIRAFFPEEFAKKLRYDKSITMLDIMSHTAGYEQHPLSTFVPSAESLTSLEETLSSSQPEQIYEPGKVIAYSNYATALAGLAVEKVSGESFADYEMNHILRPLGMNRSSGHPTLGDHPDLREAEATGYAVKQEGGFEERARYYVPLHPAGAMEGTAEDLARFVMALNDPDSPLFTRPETLRSMLSRSYTPNGEILSNAHGFWEYRAEPHVVGHSGNVKGFSGNFAVVPDERLGIVVLTNMEIEQKLTSGIIDLLVQDKTKAPEIKVPAADLSPSGRLAGYYVQSGGTYTTYHELINYLGLIKVEAKGEHDLTLSVMGLSGDLKQISPNVYKFDKSDDPRFERLAPILYAEISDGQVVRLSKGIATDILPVKGSRSIPALMCYLVLAAIAVIFFMLAPLVILIRWLLRKRKGSPPTLATHRLLTATIVCGTLLTINILYLLINALINENVTVGQMNFGVTLNWVLTILAGTLMVLSFVKGKHQTEFKRIKRTRIGVAVLFSGFTLLLANWHFFHFIP
ncbi:CubicO group peptidase (beta-lactamase class C family) [Fontibacillus phaseoli]|uniref:CubicO group peptidase (Beta-lactamase class C family) n=1 Tax=Fontibacillus phaseoli TaxID=1416533 RepID=A0A369BJ08_9BACL|nr:serine hydrolase domain-containing protein [Fontibacillus phaseoli]RCX21582.1 CubicO group peptidase (beta-lactamase class C family) [Fontibacillus phaseoli]